MGVSVITGGGLLEDPLKLLLTWAPLHLGQVKITNQGPGVRVALFNLLGRHGWHPNTGIEIVPQLAS